MGLTQMADTQSRMEAAARAEPYFTPRERLNVSDHIFIRQLGKADLVAGRYRRDKPDLGTTLPNARSETYMVVVNLRPPGGGHVLCDERHNRRLGIPYGRFAPPQ